MTADTFPGNTITGVAGTVAITMDTFTREAADPVLGSGSTTQTAWWTYTAPSTGTYTFDTEGSTLSYNDTIMAVYAYSATLAGLGTELVFDDEGGTGSLSSLTVDLTSGSTYHVLVALYAGTETGAYHLNWSGPSADTFPGNTITGVAGTATTAMDSFTREAGDPLLVGSDTMQTAWWTFTAPSTGTYTFDTNGSVLSYSDTVLGVFAYAATLGALGAALAEDEDSGTGYLSSLTVSLTLGSTYHILVAVWSGSVTGTYHLNWSGPAPPPSAPLTLSPATASELVVVAGPAASPGSPATPGTPALPASAAGITVTLDGVPAPYSWARTWQRGVSDAGSGGFVVAKDDPILATATYGSVMQFSLQGVVRQTAVVERIERAIILEGEQQAEVVSLSGRGWIAEWDWALVYPDLGDTRPAVDGNPILLGPPRQDDRYYNWTASTGFDHTSWGSAVTTDPRYGHDASSTPAQRFVRPDGWPDSISEWIWDRDSSGNVPVGDCYFRNVFSVATGGRYQVWVTADDEYELWLDGIKISERTGPYSGQCDHVEVEINAHDPYHLLAVRCRNLGGLAGLQLSVLPVNSDGTLGTYVTHSVDGGWKVRGYPAAAPGQTVGRAIEVEWLAAHIRGKLTNWDIGFTGTVDSNGAAWPLISDLTMPVGVTMLEMLTRLSDTYIDFSFSPGARTLLAYNIGTMGSGAYGDVVTQVTELTVSGEG